MTPGRVLAELEALAAHLGIGVRPEPFGKGLLRGRGGLCWVEGQALIVMDEALGRQDRIGVLAEAIATFDLVGMTVTPDVMERIEAAKKAVRKKRPARKKARPGLARAKPRGR